MVRVHLSSTVQQNRRVSSYRGILMETKKKMKSEKNLEDLPEEIICDILCRLPLKQLMQFKCVSKSHNSLLGDAYFADLHHDHQKRRCSFLLRTKRRSRVFYNIELSQEMSQTKTSLVRVKKLDKDRVSSYSGFEYAKGLFCLWSKHIIDPVFIFNPTTRESRFLPCLSIQDYSCHYSLGFDKDLKKHKILMKLVDLDMKSTRRCYVFTLGQTTWTEINCNSINNLYPMNHEGAYVDGVVYFFAGDHCNTNGNKLVAFNFTTQEFRIFSLWPYSFLGHWYNLVEVEGKLAVTDSTFSNVIIWSLQSPETGGWVRHLQIAMPPKVRLPVPKKSYIMYRRCTSTSDNKDQEIALMKTKKLPNWIVLYDPKQDKSNMIEILGLPESTNKIIGIYSYEYCIYSLGQY